LRKGEAVLGWTFWKKHFLKKSKKQMEFIKKSISENFRETSRERERERAREKMFVRLLNRNFVNSSIGRKRKEKEGEKASRQ
jgi:hypothetical protein